ncbi:MAG: hypothetical protein QM323_10275 [Acidobacteriota bacterium]|nr:hypothetical protein [Acidobacteriota bacterium]
MEAYWAWQSAELGNAGDTSFWLPVALRGSFLLGYLYDGARH